MDSTNCWPLQWPPLVEVLDTWELPPVLIERYNAAGGEGTALCGIFPEIRRAWASVDNSLFLWRFDKWWVHLDLVQCKDNITKFINEQQSIICLDYDLLDTKIESLFKRLNKILYWLDINWSMKCFGSMHAKISYLLRNEIVATLI